MKRQRIQRTIGRWRDKRDLRAYSFRWMSSEQRNEYFAGHHILLLTCPSHAAILTLTRAAFLCHARHASPYGHDVQ